MFTPPDAARKAKNSLCRGDQQDPAVLWVASASPKAHTRGSRTRPSRSGVHYDFTMMRAGLPTAVAPSGTSVIITAFAPMRAWLPIVTGRRMTAPAPISTCPPMRTWGGNGHVLQNQAIGAAGGCGMHYHSHRVQKEQPAAKLGINGDVRRGHHGPEMIAKHGPLLQKPSVGSPPFLPFLIRSQRSQELPRRIPESLGDFAREIRNLRRNVPRLLAGCRRHWGQNIGWVHTLPGHRH